MQVVISGGTMTKDGTGRRDSAPYREIVDTIRSQIRSGELAEGARIPSQAELTATHKVTRATVQKAIAALVSEGLVVTRVGSGVYVRGSQRILRSSPRRLAPSWWGTGHAVQEADTGARVRAINVEVQATAAPAELASLMGVAVGTDVIRRRRQFVTDADQRPVQLATSWYPADVAGGTRLAEVDTGPGGAPARLAELGHAPVRHRERIRVRMPWPDEANALTLPPGTPVAHIVRCSYDGQGRCIEVTDMVLDGGTYEIEYVFETP
jgi:GntR family transcriptional regulator